MNNSFCIKCKLHSNCENPCLPNLNTNVNAKILIVGPFPSAEDDKNKRIFSSNNARIFLEQVSNIKENYYITNIVKCTPYKYEEKVVRGKDAPVKVKVPSKPTLTHQKSCLPQFYKLVDTIKPKVIITIGSFTTNILLDLGLSIDKSRGHKYYHPELECFVVPMYDLDMYKEDNLYIKHLHDDLKTVKALVNTRGFRPFKSEPKSLSDPIEIEQYLNSLTSIDKLAIDLETTGLNPRIDRITDISLCKEAGKGIHIKWKDILPYFNSLKNRLEDPSILQIGQNYRFDRKFFNHNGITPHNNYFDTMLGYHTLTMMHEGSGGGLYKLERLSWLFTHQGDYKSILEQWGGIAKYQENEDGTLQEVNTKEKSKVTKKAKAQPKAVVIAPRLPIYEDIKMFDRNSYEDSIDELNDYEEEESTQTNYGCREEICSLLNPSHRNKLIDSLMNRTSNKVKGTTVRKEKGTTADILNDKPTIYIDEEEDNQLKEYEGFVSKKRLKVLEEYNLTPLQYYSAMDADVTFQVAEAIIPKINEQYSELYWDLIIPLNRTITIMEEHGTLLDQDYVKNMLVKNEEKMNDILQKIYKYIGKEFNIASPDDMREVIYKDLQVKVDPKYMTKGGKKGDKKQPSIDQYAIEHFAKIYPKKEEFFNNVLLYRGLEKESTTYFKGFLDLVDPVSNRIHGSFLQTSTATGRLSSLQPNLQNIPRETHVRNMIIPSPGCKLVGADLSQAELRILSMVSNDENMKNAFNSGFDFHSFTAAAMFNISVKEFDHENNKKHKELRGIAKTINFGLAYGRGAASIAEQVNSSVQEAEEFMNKFFKSYPKTKQWMEDTKSTARRVGYVETVHGRRRYLPYINSSDPTKRNHAENQAINTPIQGTASDCACYGLIRITDFAIKNGYKARPCMIIHDEIQMDTPDNEVDIFYKQLPVAMTQNIPKITVPLVADATILERWEK